MTATRKAVVGMEEALWLEAEHYLGTAIELSERGEARAYAERKLEWIINREGDADGARRELWYLAQLIAESVRASRLSRIFNQITEICGETGTKKDSPCKKHRAASNTSPYCTTETPKMQ